MENSHFTENLLRYENIFFTEEYIGKIPEFERVAKLFDRMLAKAKKDPNKMNPNKWEENNEIRRIFKKFFGLKAFHFYWVPSDVRNAFTFTDAALMGGEKAEGVISRKPGQGFYDTEHQVIFVIFGYCGILRPEIGFTGAELTAIFLHEIGHNFDYSPWTHLGILRKLYLELTGTTAVEENNDYKEQVYDYFKKTGDKLYAKQKQRDKDRKQDMKLLKRYLNCSAFANFIKGSTYLVSNLVMGLTGLGALSQLMITGRRKGEQFADSFATTYGFGPELMSGLLKLSDTQTLS